MSPAAFSAAFPVLGELAYLNAGTCGPVPQASVEAVAREMEAGARNGRGLAYYERLTATAGHARAAWSRLLGAPDHEIALTAGASDGIARTLALLDWEPGDEIVTSTEEHPGLLGPLGALVRRHGVEVREVPWDEVAEAVRPSTKLVAVSHVSWLRGAVINLPLIGEANIPILVDAAQSAGAIPVDLAELRQHGVVAYAAAGQKWTCGPVGTGALWVDEVWAPDRGAGVWPTYPHLSNPGAGLTAEPWPDARRLDAPSLSLELLAGAAAALGVLEAEGWPQVHTRAIERAGQVAAALRRAGLEVAERGPSTLVAWRSADPEATILHALEQGVILRGFDGLPWVRASIGAWTTDEHVERLLAAVSPR